MKERWEKNITGQQNDCLHEMKPSNISLYIQMAPKLHNTRKNSSNLACVQPPLCLFQSQANWSCESCDFTTGQEVNQIHVHLLILCQYFETMMWSPALSHHNGMCDYSNRWLNSGIAAHFTHSNSDFELLNFGSNKFLLCAEQTMNSPSEVTLGHIPQSPNFCKNPPTDSMCLNQSETYGHISILILISYIAEPNFRYIDHRITRCTRALDQDGACGGDHSLSPLSTFFRTPRRVTRKMG